MAKEKDKCGIIIENSLGEILLQLRDNKPSIPFPNCYGTFGGAIENGETPNEAIVRELKEELDYNLSDPQFYKKYTYSGYIIFMFRRKDELIRLTDLTLNEGQRAEFFTYEGLNGKPFAFNCKEIVQDYFQMFVK